MRWNLNEFLICNSSYIYNCAQDYREAAAFAFAKKPVLHEECAMLKFRICLFRLVWQNVHKGHWKDTFPLWLSFDVANLQQRRRRYMYRYIHTYIQMCMCTHGLHRLHSFRSSRMAHRASATSWTVWSRP